MKCFSLLIIAGGISACNSNLVEEKHALSNSTIQKKTIVHQDENYKYWELRSTADSVRLFYVDDYPIRNAEFKENLREIASGELISHDKVWFQNDSIHQSLIFELYTDYHRLATYCFDNNDIPTQLLERLELHTNTGKIASIDQKKSSVNEFIEESKTIERNKFNSRNKVFIGASKKSIIELYGDPSKIEHNGDLLILEWEFSGDMEDKIDSKMIARDSFGHTVTMFFRNNFLIAQILFNDIP